MVSLGVESAQEFGASQTSLNRKSDFDIEAQIGSTTTSHLSSCIMINTILDTLLPVLYSMIVTADTARLSVAHDRSDEEQG